jgi:MFS family permease
MTSASVAQGWRALRHRNFRLFWIGQLISLIGTWMQQVAQGWLVLTLTNDPFMLGLTATAQFLPILVFGLFGGLIADHLPKRRTLIATQTTAMILAAILAILTATHTVQVWHIIVLAVLLGFSSAVDMPTRQSFVFEMVGREDLVNAVALNSAIFNSARIIGPAAAGIAIGAVGLSVAFAINSLSFVAVLVGLFLIRESELRLLPPSRMPRSVRLVRDELAEGLRYVRRTPPVLLAVSVVAVSATFGMNFTVLVPPYARDVLGVGATGYGFLMAASGVGSLVAAVGIAYLRGPRVSILIGGALLLGALDALLGLTGNYLLALAFMFGAGLGGIAMAMTTNATLQLGVPDELRGRVMAVYTTTFAGSTPIGGLLTGAFASRFGASAGLLGGGLLTVAGALIAAAYVLRNRRAVLPVIASSGHGRGVANVALDAGRSATIETLSGGSARR